MCAGAGIDSKAGSDEVLVRVPSLLVCFKCRGLLFNLFSLGGGGGGGKTPTHTHTYGMSFEDPACVISAARLHYDSNGQLSIAYLRVVQTLIYPIYLS